MKTEPQLAAMRAAGLAVARALAACADAVAPGVTSGDLDAVAAAVLRDAGALPSFLGYHGFPATICVSVNEEIVHGIPDPGRRLADGDLVSIDCGAIVDGWHADAAVTTWAGAISAEVAGLAAACERAMWQGMARARPGARLSDISHAVEAAAGPDGRYGIVEDYVGHGIGSEMHMDPPVPNLGLPGRGPVLAAGMALAIEPLLVLGDPATQLLADGWTVVTADGSWSAHYEHTVAITPAGPWVLTAEDGGTAGFAALDGAAAPDRVRVRPPTAGRPDPVSPRTAPTGGVPPGRP